jgi:hypothetical protein
MKDRLLEVDLGDRLGLRLPGAGPEALEALKGTGVRIAISDFCNYCSPDSAIRTFDSEKSPRAGGPVGGDATPRSGDGGGRCSVEVRADTPTETMNDLRAAGYGLVLGLGEITGGEPRDALETVPDATVALVDAAGWRFSAASDDVSALTAAARGAVERAKSASKPLPCWLTALRVGDAADAPARAVKLAAHALALGVPRVYLDPPWGSPMIEQTLRAYAVMIRQLEGALRIALTAHGQYRIEIPGRQNRYLLWADPSIQRRPSSLQGPLSTTDLTGGWRRIEATRLKLEPDPVFVERE